MKSEIEEYQEILSHTKQALKEAPETPCKRGDGYCCTKGVPMTWEDAAILTKAFEKGFISSEIKQAAMNNLKDKKRGDRCAFLSSQNLCMIYEFRPLICVGYGVGGYLLRSEISLSQEEYYQAVDDYYLLGIEHFVNQDQLAGFFCRQCRLTLESQNLSYPIHVVNACSRAVSYAHERKACSVDDFVQKNLPKIKTPK